jgi:alpha-L-rhamnosidase
MALLGDSVPKEKQSQVIDHLFKEANLYRTTIYFLHYLFEVCQRTGRMEKFFERLQLWFDLEKQGFKTMVESPEPSRSDCHAWGAHPVYHYFATVLGIRPSSPGFKTVRIEPQLGELQSASGTMVHPRGLIKVSVTADPDKFSGEIELPEGVSGELVVNDRTIALNAGKQTF